MNTHYTRAKDRYARIGVDTDAAEKTLSAIPISIHCWQGDDVGGFEPSAGGLSGGIQATGNYPGKARTPAELMADFETAISLIPGKKKINLHASYAICKTRVDRDALLPEHFADWAVFAKKNKLGIDFNPTYFSHPLAADSLTLSHPDDEVRSFWQRHGIACRRIAAWFAEELGQPCVFNVWIPDGYKHIPADRLGPRLRLRGSLDKIFAEKLEGVIDCVESKLFGIGLEAYTVGSSEFYTAYAASRPGVYNLLDNGHYHPTEVISDKIPSLLPFFDKIPLHVTRPFRWDSDHVVLFEDELKEIAQEIVRNDAADKVLIGLDFFDASINRVAAWVIGARNMQRALLYALLAPHDRLRGLQDKGGFTELMMWQEELKTFPFGDIWEHYCKTQGVPGDESWFKTVTRYEDEVLRGRG
jgi:L-rhamnose isomerase